MLELLNQELGAPQYEGLTDVQTADLVNAKTVTVRQLVPTWRVKQHAIENGYYAQIMLAANDPAQNIQVRVLCINVIAWIDDNAGKIQNLDMDAAATTTMLNGLIGAGLLTELQKESLLNLANVTKKWVDHIGIGEVGIGYVRAAKGMN